MSTRVVDKHVWRSRIRRSQPSRLTQIVVTQLQGSRRNLILAALSMLGFTITELLAPWPLKVIIDQVLLNTAPSFPLTLAGGLFSENKMLAVLIVSLSIILLAALRGMFAYAQLYLTSRIGYQITYALQRELFIHLQRLSLAFHHRARAGDLLTKVTGDTKTLKDVFADSALSLAAEILTLIGMFTVMFVLNWQLSLVVLATFPMLGILLFYLFRQIKISSSSQRKLEGVIASRISESLASISLVQAFGRERYERERFVAESDQTLEESIRTARLEATATRTVEIISAAGVCAVVLFGAIQALNGLLTPGAVLIFVTYVTNMYKPIRNLAKLSTRFSKAMVSAERIRDILDTEPEIRDRRNALAASSIRGRVSFEHVSFAYGDGNYTLRDISFTVPAGKRIALVGASGAGKSTIASLILRFYDATRGQITIDGINIQDYQRESLREQIGVVLQDTILFGTTIRENIAYGKPNATLGEIEQAARLAHAHEFIMAMPKGYDTLLSERGSTLSGGQRQRISLARAILKQPTILILDEPTSAVDAESAHLIQEAVNRFQQGKTTIVIAHHFAALEEFDQILVLRDGTIVEQGTHQELLQRQGYYHELSRLQSTDGSKAPLVTAQTN